jgi:predicted dehydrogenase
VVRAEARLSSPKVDRYMQADLRFPDGRTGRVTQSLFSSTLLALGIRVEGEEGQMRVFNPIAPHVYHRLTVRRWDSGKSPVRGGRRSERVPGEATYTCQLRAFVAAVREGRALPTDAHDAVKNMAVIDAIYDRAGLPRRGTS